MTTMAENVIAAGTDNRPSMLEKSLPPDVHNLVNHHSFAKEIWDRVKLLMEGTKLSLQERESLIHAPVINSPPVVPQQAYPALAVQHKPQAVFPHLDSGLVVPSFLPGDDPIASLNKAMAFISTSISSWLQCRMCRGDRVRVLQCTQPKRLRNYEWFKEKMLLVQAHEPKIVADEEQLAFLADPGVALGLDTQTTLPINAALQTDDLDAFDLDCDEALSARAMLMANLSSYDSDVLLEENAMIMSIIDEMSNQVAKCNAVNLKNITMGESLTVKLERYEEQIKNYEE
ncbi:hypothetical protein Tco_1384999 [Tanacetum coccineum]